jgi:sulfur-oxidizing protein SoxY
MTSNAKNYVRDSKRRELLQAASATTVVGLAITAGLLPKPAQAQTGDWNKAAFETKSLQDAVKALGGAQPVLSKDVIVTGPDIAENGAVVPIGVKSNIAGTTQVAVLIEKNPNILSALFDLPAGTDADVSTRVKMAQSSNVFALVKANDKYYYAAKEVKVTLGGCGG